MNEQLKELKRMYIEFINALDPCWDAYEDVENVTELEPEEMLYNLIEIKKDWDLTNDIELSKRLNTLIKLFEQNNVKPSNHKNIDDQKAACPAPLFTNDEILILSNGLLDSMFKLDEAAKTCSTIPEAYEAIRNHRNKLEALNSKVLALYDSAKEGE